MENPWVFLEYYSHYSCMLIVGLDGVYMVTLKVL